MITEEVCLVRSHAQRIPLTEEIGEKRVGVGWHGVPRPRRALRFIVLGEQVVRRREKRLIEEEVCGVGIPAAQPLR